MNVSMQWKGGMAFEGQTKTGVTYTMDAYPESGGQGLGPTPVEAMMSALAACSAMDVLSILRKKRQEVTSYRVEVEAHRDVPEGQYPRPFSRITVKHIVSGPNLDAGAVDRAVELSDSKYCSVATTLRLGPQIAMIGVVE